MKGFSGAFLAVSGMVYVMLMTNLLLVVTGLPVWVFGLMLDLRKTWLWVAIFAILLAPGLAGAYSVFKSFSLDASVTAIRTFFRGWWGSLRRVLPVGVLFQVLFFVLGVDLYVMTLWGYGSLALPVVIVIVALAGVTAMVSWVGLLDRPDLTRRAVMKASLYLSVRKGGWSLLSLVVLGVEASIIWVKPAVGLGLLLGPALYVVWGNSRRTLVEILPPSEQIIDEDAPYVPRRRPR